MEIVYRPLSALKPNPKNPRKATRDAVANLAESIKENPQFFEARPILLSDRTGEFIIIGGERRSEAAKLLGMESVPTILLSGLTEAEEDEILIKDNTHAGVWDEKKLARWDKGTLQSWGAEVREKKMTEILSDLQYRPMYYEPKEAPQVSLMDCINFDKFNAKVEAIEAMKLPARTKQVLRWFCYRFIKIDFERVADYYYFNATDAEKRAIERLRLVLIDGGGQGFIDDDLLKITGFATQEEESIEND